MPLEKCRFECYTILYEHVFDNDEKHGQKALGAANVDIREKLSILADAAKYDASCASSGTNRKSTGSIGSVAQCGICHSFAGDGRCISLLKVLKTNVCRYDCAYCHNRRSNDVPRATFTARELCELTMEFYRRNYIEGLFLSSAVTRDPDTTMEALIRTLELVRGAGFGDEQKAREFDRLMGAEILLIDDLGTEPMVRNITVEYLFSLINERTGGGMHTVIATNLSFEDLKNRYTERISSRLLDKNGFEVVGLAGEDLRLIGRRRS